MSSYENNIIDTIELMTDNMLSSSDFNKTVQATILKAIDTSIGSYYVKYGDSSFEAYSISTNVIYADGTLVYVLIPNNDTTQDKIIVGSVDKTEKQEEVNTITKDDRYEKIGVNCANSLNVFELCSYTPNGDIKTLYNKNENINLIGLNERDAKEYLNNQSVILLGADFKTSLPAEQQIKGNYGIVFELIFKDSLDRLVTKTYTIDINSMSGNPYKLTDYTNQNQYFSIDDDFQYINRIYIFEKNFPKEENDKDNDIFIKNIIIQSVNSLTDEEIESTRLYLATPNGSYFKLEDEDTEKKIITATLKIEGQEVTKDNLSYYWFKENDNITSINSNFSLLGGNGWELVSTTKVNQLEIEKTDITSKEQRYKCVIEIDGNRLSQEITLKNYSSDYEISIVSDSGTVFMYELKNPILTCLVNGVEDDNFDYSWSKQDDNGYEQLNIATNKYTPQLNNIIKSATYKCTVSYSGNYIGVAALTIYSQIDSGSGFTLRIANGDKLFTYNADGLSPMHQSLENPIEIQPLKCILYDNYGNVVADDILDLCEIKWTYPQENTLIKINKIEENILYYSLEDKYNSEYKNSDIQVKVYYKDLVLITKTTISFNKQGDDGTNGSDLTCKIVLNTNDNVTYPQVKNGSLNYTPLNAGKWFLVQAYKDGDKIFEGYESKNGFDIEWSIYKNKYSSTVEDDSDITIDPDQNFIAGSLKTSSNGSDSFADIVKVTVTYKEKIYYASMPIVYSQNSVGYNITTSGGFNKVQYGSNGRNPKYIDKPFEIKVLRNGIDVSLNNSVSYEWEVLGQVYKNGIWEDASGLLENPLKTNLTKNKKSFIPCDYFNGECLNLAVQVKIFNNVNTNVGTIRIPIHMYLNRFDNANIAGWDGNSIQIKKDGGYILTPQIGTGKKEKDNSFTGMIMGEAKESGIDNSKVGLIGYSKGEQSLFMDAESGAAIFGKASGGKLSIDPDSEHAYLYSSNYWNNYNYKGLPQSYADSNKQSSGMLIDLDTPEINFGNGNFKIDADGILQYKGGLNSKGVYSNLLFPIRGYGWKSSAFQNLFQTAYRTSYGIVTHLPYIISGDFDTTYYVYKIDKIGYKNIGFGIPVWVPDNFQIEKIILKLDYVAGYEALRSTYTNEEFEFDDAGITQVGYIQPSWMDKVTIKVSSDYSREEYHIQGKNSTKVGIYLFPAGTAINAYWGTGDWASQNEIGNTTYSYGNYSIYPNGGKEEFTTSKGTDYLIKELSLTPDTKNTISLEIDLTEDIKNQLFNGAVLYFASLETYSDLSITNQSIVTGSDENQYYKSSTINVLQKVGEGYRDAVYLTGNLEIQGYINFNG